MFKALGTRRLQVRDLQAAGMTADVEDVVPWTPNHKQEPEKPTLSLILHCITGVTSSPPKPMGFFWS